MFEELTKKYLHNNRLNNTILYYVLYIIGSLLSGFSCVTSYLHDYTIDTPIIINFTFLCIFIIMFIMIIKHKDWCKPLTSLLLHIAGFVYFPMIAFTASRPQLAILYQFLIPLLYIVVDTKAFTTVIINLTLILGINIPIFLNKGIIPNTAITMCVVSYIVNISTTVLVRMILIKLKFALIETEHLKEIYRNLARLDPLTKIYNRLGIDEAIAHLSNQQCFCIMIDIDDFKKVNDTYGHEYGDKILKQVADICLRFKKKEKLYVSRFGGEEFLLVSYYKALSTTYTICEDIRKKVNAIKLPNDQNLSISLGISNVGLFSEDIRSQADDRLYFAKANGKNQTISGIHKSIQA